MAFALNVPYVGTFLQRSDVIVGTHSKGPGPPRIPSTHECVCVRAVYRERARARERARERENEKPICLQIDLPVSALNISIDRQVGAWQWPPRKIGLNPTDPALHAGVLQEV